tara:strand:- start:57 stop:551 length:495 start_codon:yes stop_codon:yes gene_type:complete
MTERIGLYPGSFDPITNGHMDIIRRSLKVVDKLIVGIAVNVSKSEYFNTEERLQIIEEDIKNIGLSDRIKIHSFEGLLMDYAKSIGANVIIRGLRAVSDFEYEFQMTGMNARLEPSIETVFLMSSENQHFISSKLVKEVFKFNGDISSFVSANVLKNMKNKLSN